MSFWVFIPWHGSHFHTGFWCSIPLCMTWFRILRLVRLTILLFLMWIRLILLASRLTPSILDCNWLVQDRGIRFRCLNSHIRVFHWNVLKLSLRICIFTLLKVVDRLICFESWSLLNNFQRLCLSYEVNKSSLYILIKIFYDEFFLSDREGF